MAHDVTEDERRASRMSFFLAQYSPPTTDLLLTSEELTHAYDTNSLSPPEPPANLPKSSAALPSQTVTGNSREASTSRPVIGARKWLSSAPTKHQPPSTATIGIWSSPLSPSHSQSPSSSSSSSSTTQFSPSSASPSSSSSASASPTSPAFSPSSPSQWIDDEESVRSASSTPSPKSIDTRIARVFLVSESLTFMLPITEELTFGDLKQLVLVKARKRLNSKVEEAVICRWELAAQNSEGLVFFPHPSSGPWVRIPRQALAASERHKASLDLFLGLPSDIAIFTAGSVLKHASHQQQKLAEVTSRGRLFTQNFTEVFRKKALVARPTPSTAPTESQISPRSRSPSPQRGLHSLKKDSVKPSTSTSSSSSASLSPSACSSFSSSATTSSIISPSATSPCTSSHQASSPSSSASSSSSSSSPSPSSSSAAGPSNSSDPAAYQSSSSKTIGGGIAAPSVPNQLSTSVQKFTEGYQTFGRAGLEGQLGRRRPRSNSMPMTMPFESLIAQQLADAPDLQLSPTPAASDDDSDRQNTPSSPVSSPISSPPTPHRFHPPTQRIQPDSHAQPKSSVPLYKKPDVPPTRQQAAAEQPAPRKSQIQPQPRTGGFIRDSAASLSARLLPVSRQPTQKSSAEQNQSKPSHNKPDTQRESRHSRRNSTGSWSQDDTGSDELEDEAVHQFSIPDRLGFRSLDLPRYESSKLEMDLGGVRILPDEFEVMSSPPDSTALTASTSKEGLTAASAEKLKSPTRPQQILTFLSARKRGAKDKPDDSINIEPVSINGPKNRDLEPSNIRRIRKLSSHLGGSGAEVWCVLIGGWTCAMKIGPASVIGTAVLQEISMLSVLPPHAHIVRYLGHSITGEVHLLLMELYDTQFESYLQQLPAVVGKNPIPKKVAIRAAFECIQAVEHMHAHGVAHRDIKPANVFLRIDPTGKPYHAAIGDFDTATRFNYLTTPCGSPAFMAPEVIRSKTAGKYSELCDNYSLGMLLFVFATGKVPFDGMSSLKVPEAVLAKKRPKVPPFVVDDPIWAHLMDVSQQLSRFAPQDRMSLSRALKMLEPYYSTL